jgi:toxin ParE1/3/4
MTAAAEWYETRRTGAGDRFLTEVARYVELLRAHPGIGTIVCDRRGRELRAMLIRSFPYRIIYQEAPSLLIVAVAHTSRRPGYWSSRR